MPLVLKPKLTDPSDEGKTREQLLSELREMRARMTIFERSEEVLKESEEKYRAFFESSIDAILITSPDGSIEAANPEACRMFGMTENEIIQAGRSGITDMSDPMLKLAMGERARTGRFKGELRKIRKDGTMFPGEVSIGAFTDINGIIKTAMTIRDITERKRTEEELKEAKIQAELYLDLMGHDINNFHQVAMGYLEMARDMMHLDENQREFLDRPLEVLQRSSRLIDNVRKLQKLKDGVFRTDLVDVCRVLKDVEREYEAVSNKSITFNNNGNENCLVLANELLQDVFSNLVSNAIKHSNGINANIIMDIDKVQESGSQYYRVIIEDNGPGISDDFKDKIFNRLLSGTTKSKGMGLGLYLVKTLVDSYNGRVWVENRIFIDYTKGARFVVMLPAIEK